MKTQKHVTLQTMVFALSLFFISFSAISQEFHPKFSPLVMTGGAQGYVILNDGKKVEGKINASIVNDVKINRVTVKEENKNKHKFKAESIKELYIKVKKSGEILMGNFKKIGERKFYIFKKVLNPKGKMVMLQLRNPGFDSKIQVFSDPNVKKNSIGIGSIEFEGNGDTSYYFYREGENSILVKKSKYKKKSKYNEFLDKLYHNCTELKEKFPKFSFKDAASHVYFFDKSCK